MQRLKTPLLALCTIMLLAVSIPGYAQVGQAQDVDCRFCHKLFGVAGAQDFYDIYANPSSHHPVGIEYPAGLKAKQNFIQPNGRSAGIAFFDTNGNGQHDSNEILLFDTSGVAVVTCSSCHAMHGHIPPPAKAIRNHYLRFDNTGSALCLTCHIY